MPITFHLRPEAKLVISVHTGKTPDDELIASYKSLHENNMFETSMNRLMDPRQADITQRGKDVIRQFAELMQDQFKENGANPKVAVVATRESIFDLLRIFIVFMEVVPVDIAVFHSVEETLAWFGLPESFMEDINKDTRQ